MTYRLQKPDFVVVTAETAAGSSYTRYATGPQGLRGLLIGYDKALSGEVGRLVIAMANAFDPFPARVRGRRPIQARTAGRISPPPSPRPCRSRPPASPWPRVKSWPSCRRAVPE